MHNFKYPKVFANTVDEPWISKPNFSQCTFLNNPFQKKNRRYYRFEQNFETVSWNKEINRTAKKTKFQTRTCAQHETPKLKCKTYGKLKI
jgi:hypothetical protein